ncbi:MAG: class I adenylate-forming enzyme family protein [Hyphomicrobiaceae bacterium]
MVDNITRAWLGQVPAQRHESHYGNRVIRCFVERPHNAYDLLRDAANRNPDGEALVCDDQRLSYREFECVVQKCAAGLDAKGINAGDRVAMLLGNSLLFPIVLFAVLRIGAIAVPMNVREQSQGLAYMIDQSGAKLLLFDSELAERLPVPDEVPALVHRVAVDREAPVSDLPLLADHAGPLAAEVNEEDTAVILYTSGTTGRPKGAMLTHLGICHSALHYEACMGLTSVDRAVAAVPLSHVTGVIAFIASMSRAAATLIVMPEFKASAFLELAGREEMTHSLMVPAMYNLCLLAPEFDAARHACWRIGGYGGAPMAPATIARFAQRLPKLQLMNAYGSTETTSPVTLMPPAETVSRSDSVGCAVPCGDVLVMDDDGHEVPVGESGELWLGGPMVVPGYWENPAATAENFVGGYWRSGDIGSKDSNGFVRVFDRKKDMINRGGYKIYSVEVENILLTIPDVIEAAVVAEPCPVLGERVHALVVSDVLIDADDIKKACANQLADYKVPDRITVRTEPLPRNAGGKLLKRELRTG